MALGPHNTLNGDDWDLPQVEPVVDEVASLRAQLAAAEANYGFAKNCMRSYEEELQVIKSQLATARKALEDIHNGFISLEDMEDLPSDRTPAEHVALKALHALRSLNNGNK